MDAPLPLQSDSARSCILHPISPTEGHANVIAGHDNDHLVLDIFRYTSLPTFVLDANLHVTHVSDSYCSVSGIRNREQLLGAHVDDLGANATVPSNSLSHRGIRAAQDTAGPSIFNESINDRVWTLRTVPVIRDGTICSFLMEVQDTTEAHQKQLELEERMYTNETFKILVDTIKDVAIFMLDPQGNVATWNAGAQAFKGYTKSEIIGKHFSGFYTQEDRDNDKPARELRDALNNGACEDEGWRMRKDGSRFWANVVITPVRKDGALLGFSKVTRDLSERKKAESKLIAVYEEASRLKSEFLANMSHEIRTPMHGMLSALTLLLDTQLNPEQLELAHIIQESGEVLLHVINDILDYSKLASGSFSISHDIISVREIILSVFRAHEKVSKPGITLEKDIDPRLPIAAEGDSFRFRQIVENLVSNASKFTEQGYIRIQATQQHEDDTKYIVLIEVIDTGIGVPLIASGSLFTPFNQFDNSATKRYKGTGLGLSICKSLVELMGGNIGFRPNPEGTGSVFWFTAQLKRVEHSKRLGLIQNRLDNISFPTSPTPGLDQLNILAGDRRVLLAEDNAINRKVMLKILIGLGFNHVDIAVDGNEAVLMALKASPSYDLILMDINMPFLDGVQATKEIRGAGLDVPIVAMTANALKGQAESYIAKGMTGYIAKPVDRKLLAELLLSCLEQEDSGSARRGSISHNQVPRGSYD
ncbi:sensor histidine kinase-like protein/response regulator Fos-1 [Karstenula rhodostoma CBS 690.94]|uniref:Sensor histidine kinase-like protein/response regulator Fos-1 n=1 Tax=Karstenula rhodostoma CBS 690.94 TaxID=1392251 RepID=A0A9P4PLX0_9PLEO|nr:sensor histidine kinase-like protein/response regulator Fos-1 [Karstenula rhodostoma CBS 690.94]